MDCDGEEHLCEDLVGAHIIEHRLDDAQLQRKCYRFVDDVDACMELNMTTGICHVYYPKRPTLETWYHERNHCRGWGHSRSVFGRYRWKPFPEAIKFDVGDMLRKSDGSCVSPEDFDKEV